MDRLTSKEHGANTIVLCNRSPGIWDICKGKNNIYKIHGFAADKLAAYEDTGLTPEEVATMKAEYSDTFQAHLNQMCDIKDKRIAELEAKNADLIEQIDRLVEELEHIR